MHIFFSKVIRIKFNSWLNLSIFIFYDVNIDPKQAYPTLPSQGATEKFGSKIF